MGAVIPQIMARTEPRAPGLIENGSDGASPSWPLIMAGSDAPILGVALPGGGTCNH